MSSQASLQDYLEEVQEHLLTMEKSLLVLEQEGADQEQISQIFRAAHSLKGASAYMGFEGLAALTHEMETQINAIQLDSGSIPTKGISMLLQCKDIIHGAVEYLRKEGTEPVLDNSFLENLRSAFLPGESGQSPREEYRSDRGSSVIDDVSPDLLHDLEKDLQQETADAQAPVDEQDFQALIQEEDEELLTIFIHSFRENFFKLLDVLKSTSDPSLTPDEKNTTREITDKLISSARYMDYQPVVAIVSGWEANLGSNGADLDRCDLLAQLKNSGVKLDSMIPGLDVSSLPFPEHASNESHVGDEDEELFSIFLHSFRENLSILAKTILSESLEAQDLERASELTDNLIRSSYYMGYEDILELLERWNEFLTALKCEEKDSAEIRDAFASLCSELPHRLPGLTVPDLEPGLTGGLANDSMNGEIDLCFQSSADTESHAENIFPAPEGQQSPAPHGQEKDLILSSRGRRQQTLVNKLHAKELISDERKERTVLFAENVQQNTATLRVDAQKVDKLLNQIGELVVTRSEFIQTAALLREILRDVTSQRTLPKSELRRLRLLGLRLNESTQSLGRIANDLQGAVMRVRMLPIIQLFERFPRIVRDQALKLGKKAELIIEGGETEIDKRVLERMNDPLIQFIRNALVHGIETPGERTAAGKLEQGIIRLAAYQSGDHVVIEIEDNGRGIDIEKLRNILQGREDVSQHELDRLSDEEIVHAIFLPGVSTYEKVDGAAGRGVGLDVVKQNVESMGGSIAVESSLGEGTRFVIRIPLTVAIIRALLVSEADQIFTLPLNSISEIMRYRPEDVHTIEGFPVISLRGDTIPLIDLRHLLNMGQAFPESRNKFVVIVTTSFNEVGLVVDGLLGEREVVLKSIDDGFHTIQGFSGATILGDGRVSLVIDVSAMLRIMQNSVAAARKNAPASGSIH